MRPRPPLPRPPRRLLAAAALAALAGCAGLRGEGPVRGEPSAQRGMLEYGVGRLVFLAPDAWEATGGARRLELAHPADLGRLDVRLVEPAFADEKACLAAAEESLAKGAARLTNVRRHPSSFAGKRAVAQEADQAGWHGWAWAVCDGPVQYRIFFAGRAPVAADVLEAWRGFTRSAAFEAAR